MKPHPIEVVVIRDLVVRTTPTPSPEPAEGPAVFSEDQQDELDALDEAAGCWVRKRLLLELGVAAEPVHVAALAGRTGIDPNTASHHLGILRRGGFVRGRKQGKPTYYTAVPSRVRVDRRDGALSLTLTHPSGAYRTMGVSSPLAEVRSAEPARVTEPDVGNPQPRDAG